MKSSLEFSILVIENLFEICDLELVILIGAGGWAET
jgi:hypothetical protein